MKAALSALTASCQENIGIQIDLSHKPQQQEARTQHVPAAVYEVKNLGFSWITLPGLHPLLQFMFENRQTLQEKSASHE